MRLRKNAHIRFISDIKTGIWPFDSKQAAIGNSKNRPAETTEMKPVD